MSIILEATESSAVAATMGVAVEDGRLGLPSASSMDRYAHCPGSFAAEIGLPPIPTKQVTSDGTIIHEALYTGEDDELSLSQKEITERLRVLEKQSLESWKEAFRIVGEIETIREQRFWIRNRSLEPLASAQPDVVFIGKHEGNDLCAGVINYKSGYLETTPSERNWQCRTEIVAVINERPEIKRARGGIAASRLFSKLDETDYDTEELRRCDTEVKHVVWRTKQPNAERVPGVHCTYCRAKDECRQYAVYSVLIDQSINPTPRAELAKLAPDQLKIIQSVSKMTPGELAFIKSRKKSAENLFEAVDAKLKTLPEAELAAVGYKLAPGNNNKEITNVRVACERLSGIIPSVKLMDCMKISRGAVADYVATSSDMTKKAAAELVDKTIGDVLIEKPGNPRLKEI